MESIERTLNNMTIDDGPWRQHDQSQPVWGNGGVQPGRVWGHVPVQFQNRSPWHDPNEFVQGEVNEALGLTNAGGQSSQWGGPMSGGPNDFDKQIWSDPLHDPHFVPPQQSGPEWSTGGMGGGAQQPIWSDGGLSKESDSFWKQQQQPQGPWGAPPMGGGWPQAGRQMNHPNGPPPQGPRGLMQQDFSDFPGAWGPNGIRPKQMNAPWGEQQRLPGMPQRTGGRQQQSRGYGGGSGVGGVDVSIPPPMDMHMGMGMGRPMPPPGHGAWKGPGGMQGGQSGGRHQYQQRGGLHQGNNASQNNMWNGNNGGGGGAMNDQYSNYNNFPISGASDDLTLTVWHDPNGELKKWQRDTGVNNWGDPEKQEDRPIRYWLVPEGEDEDLESALSRCPVPQKKVGKPDGESRYTFPMPLKRSIVVTGWGELPENDPNNPGKSGLFDEPRWNDAATTTNPWYLPNQVGNPFGNENTGSWVQAGTIPLNETGSSSQHQLAEMLKHAVDKGYLDISVTMSQNLPPLVLQNVNSLLKKIPALESVDNELKQLVESVRPPNGAEEDNLNPSRYMNEVQKVEYNRLIIDVTAARIDVSELSKKINRALLDAGIVQPQQERVPTTSEDYHYSFLE